MQEKKTGKPKYFYHQTGIIPFLLEENEIKVCLITSRKGKKWILPKGIQEPGKTFIQIAEQEAFEEAGLKGKILPTIFGKRKIKKWGGVCNVDYFLMEVKEVYKIYPEDFRKRIFVTKKEAKKTLSKKLFKLINKAFHFYSQQEL